MVSPLPVDSPDPQPPDDPARLALPLALRRSAAVAIAASTTVATGLGVAYAGDGVPSAVDTWLQPPGNPWMDESTTTVALLLDLLAEPGPAITLALLAAALCLLLRRRRLAVLAVVGQGATGVATTGLKPVVGRTIHGLNECYPSGHTAALTALAIVLGLMSYDVVTTGHPGRAPLATSVMVAGVAAAGAGMGWAQSYLRAHYPTDIIGGFCTAVAIICAVAWLVDALAPRLRRSPPPV